MVRLRNVQRSLYERRGSSMGQRVLLGGIGALCVAVAGWLLFAGGLHTAAGWLGHAWKPGDPARRALLVAALTVYYIRILFTAFVFLRRGMSWSEVFTIGGWMLCIYLLLAIEGGTNGRPAGAATVAGSVLFVFGSWMNTYAEYGRHIWKRQAENRERLYTQGLFRHSRHPNYLGDLISFSGICLISGVWVTAAIPVLMAAGFVFVNIPALESHLHEHYGAAFDEYTARTRKLVPFLY